MTTNRTRAVQIINAAHIESARDLKFPNPRALAQALVDAGLLTPDLPTPDRDGRWWPTAASIGNVTINPAGEIVLHSGNFRDMQLHLTPGKADDLADILKAAAHATQEKK